MYLAKKLSIVHCSLHSCFKIVPVSPSPLFFFFQGSEKWNENKNTCSLLTYFQVWTRNSIGGFLCPSVGHSDRVGKCENALFRPCPPVRNRYWPCIRPCFHLCYLLSSNQRLISLISPTFNASQSTITLSWMQMTSQWLYYSLWFTHLPRQTV